MDISSLHSDDAIADCVELPNNLVLCVVCQEARNGEEKTFQRHSWSRHCTSGEHQEALRTRISRRAIAEATQRNYDVAYNSPAAVLVHGTDSEAARHAAQISTGPSHLEKEYLRTTEMHIFNSEEQAEYFPPIDIETTQKHNEELLRQECELLRLQANEDLMDGQAEDASIPELAAEFMSLGRLVLSKLYFGC